LPFGVMPTALRESGIDVAAAVARADQVVAGRFHPFSGEWRALPSGALGWRKHPESGLAFPDIEWWKVPHFDRGIGDIKEVWEPSRFAWVYDLVRGWLLTGDRQYPAAFHRLLAEWISASPPFRGPQWACGQETAIRAIALLHAEANLPATPEERGRLTTLLAWSGERIADAIGYALSQRNNHGLSEAAGLVVLGVRFGAAHPEADRWRRTGTELMERQIREQFLPDGWYIQHSFNYLRVALDQCVVAERALRAAGTGLSAGARERLGAAVGLIAAVIGPDGSVPNHGPNDGALVLPYSLAHFSDHRPAITRAAALFGASLPADILPDRESLAWLGVAAPGVSAARGDGITRGAGWVVARAGEVTAFLRAGHYHSRPGHLDVLHLDVRGPGGPVLVDPGTFRYHAPAPWNNGLASAAVHNGPVLDDREPGWRGPRFLWYLWPAGTVESATMTDGVARIVATSATGIRRTVLVRADVLEVRDQVDPRVAHSLRVRWTLHPDAPPDAVRVEGASTSGSGVEGAVAGWYSPLYGTRVPTRYIDAERPAWAGVELISRIQVAR